MNLKDVISLSDLAMRFSKAKGMEKTGYNWRREAPGRKKDRSEEPVGNSLAVLRSIRQFNESNKDPITVYKVVGYDGTNRKTLVIDKGNVIRLKGYILRGQAKRPGRKKSISQFKVLEEVEI